MKQTLKQKPNQNLTIGQKQSLMAKEARSSPDVIASQITANQSLIEQLVEQINLFEPTMIMMVGRGSSDHAGVFAKYLFEVELGIPVCFAAPSVSGVFNKSLNLQKTLAIVISQSGKSPDLLNQTRAIQSAGAYSIALVNDTDSPLAALTDAVLPMQAGPELAVAATKSYLCSLSALLHLTAVWKQDPILKSGIVDMTEGLRQVCGEACQLNTDFLRDLKHCVVLGRGFGYAIAREIALKLKEVCSIQAEAFSSAEFIHGPVTLVEGELAIINIDIKDESESIHHQQIDNVASRGAKVLTINHPDIMLPYRVLPLFVMLRFYLDVERAAIEMEFDPDAPPGLNKVTETI